MSVGEACDAIGMRRAAICAAAVLGIFSLPDRASAKCGDISGCGPNEHRYDVRVRCNQAAVENAETADTLTVTAWNGSERLDGLDTSVGVICSRWYDPNRENAYFNLGEYDVRPTHFILETSGGDAFFADWIEIYESSLDKYGAPVRRYQDRAVRRAGRARLLPFPRSCRPQRKLGRRLGRLRHGDRAQRAEQRRLRRAAHQPRQVVDRARLRPLRPDRHPALGADHHRRLQLGGPTSSRSTARSLIATTIRCRQRLRRKACPGAHLQGRRGQLAARPEGCARPGAPSSPATWAPSRFPWGRSMQATGSKSATRTPGSTSTSLCC